MKTVTLIKTNGTIEEIEIPDLKRSDRWKWAVSKVGQYTEEPLRIEKEHQKPDIVGFDKYFIFWDEDGRLKNDKPNKVASYACGFEVFGDVLFIRCVDKKLFMDDKLRTHSQKKQQGTDLAYYFRNALKDSDIIPDPNHPLMRILETMFEGITV